ncbi:uncharacterized protein LY79DRAFT_411494 [Colletotrichum navitas]|uniref:Uncharacterized protein n=1 Tax=Colletotrichum navitas TaxID=681940 RepID=A0AAD8PP61_9PEZI|nr:uncharacterized protein LY79DRAFT_411494 [Colletotrichum navitas]KAK1573438.1 hypothetical protein LY79DRAFT_411494 [Colletotrichum navitas]
MERLLCLGRSFIYVFLSPTPSCAYSGPDLAIYHLGPVSPNYPSLPFRSVRTLFVRLAPAGPLFLLPDLFYLSSRPSPPALFLLFRFSSSRHQSGSPVCLFFRFSRGRYSHR